MYQILGNIVKNPFTIIVILVLVIFLFFSSISAISGIGTWLGFETKENIEKKLNNTEAELDKAVEINKNNEKDRILNDQINETNKTIEKELKHNEKSIVDDEKKILEELNKISIEPTIVTTKPIKVVYKKESNTITDSQSKKLSILLARSKQFKGEIQ